MKTTLCPEEEVKWYYQGGKWCSSKLPCGRCISLSNRQEMGCQRKALKGFVDCDNCKYRFVCLTCSIDGETNFEMRYLLKNYES